MKTIKLSFLLAGFFLLVGNASFAQFNKDDLKKEAGKLEKEAKKAIDKEVKKAEEDPDALKAKGQEVLNQVQEKRAEKKAAKTTEATSTAEEAVTEMKEEEEGADVAKEAESTEAKAAKPSTEGESAKAKEASKAEDKESNTKLSAKERAMEALKKNEAKTKELTESIGSGDDKVTEGRSKIEAAKAKLAEDKAAGNLSDEDEKMRQGKIVGAEAAIDALEGKLKSAKGE
jgi:hypothetical protein